MKFGYARVSGLSQDLAQQTDQLIKVGVPKENVYAEKFTGTTEQRPQWQKLNRQLRRGDEVVFTKVDRIGRSVKVAIDIVNDLLNKGVKVYIIQLGGYVSKHDTMGKMLFNFLTIMAEFEHDMIVDRLAQGKAYAKAHNPNYHEGRPKRTITNRYKAVYEYSLNHSIRETALATGVSESTVKRIKRQVRKEGLDHD
ncbi:recombinase family protein [Limosilactobacillus reuteri]